MQRAEIESFLVSLGIADDRVQPMAEQLEKRARQLCIKRNETYEATIVYLIGLMKQGWAAKKDRAPLDIHIARSTAVC